MEERWKIALLPGDSVLNEHLPYYHNVFTMYDNAERTYENSRLFAVAKTIPINNVTESPKKKMQN